MCKPNRKSNNGQPKVKLLQHLKNNVKLLSWNINNYKSSCLGDKLKDIDFLHQIADCDIVSLVETHATGHDLSLPGFSSPFRIDRPISKGAKKAFGGVAVFLKSYLTDSKNVYRVCCESKNAIWLKLNSTFTGLDKDTFICNLYFSPQTKRNRLQTSKYVPELQKEIEKFTSLGKVLLLGDFNARTNTLTDFIDIEEDIADVYTNTRDDVSINTRNSEDTAPACKRGRDLLNLCKDFSMSIINGRKTGDLFGQITCLKWNGCSVVDYAICSNDLFDLVSYFCVKHFLPHISDHAPIELHIDISGTLVPRLDKEIILTDIPNTFMWDSECKQKITDALKHEHFQKEFQKTEQLLRKNTFSLSNLNRLILNVCKVANIRKKKHKTSDPQKKHAKWFDENCKLAKENLKELARQFRGQANNSLLRDRINCKRKEYKSLIRKTKRDYQSSIFDKMSLDYNNPNKFWKHVRTIRSPHRYDAVSYMPAEKIMKHFSSLLNVTTPLEWPPLSTTLGPLDGEIIASEMVNGRKVLKSNKSCGLDAINNEIILCIDEIYPDLFLSMFNHVLSSGKFPELWTTSLILPIHKKGPKSDLGNYRGISLMSCLSKFFTAVLNNRLTDWALKRQIFSPSQLGFLKGNRTSDAHIILANLIDKYCFKNNSKIYSCFVDFEKAFDKIPRDKLIKKLELLGITGKFLNIITTMYKDDQARIKIGQRMTPTVSVTQGVRQGCVLSPTLFNLFISDFEPLLKQKLDTDPLFIDDEYPLHCLIWADDIILLSETQSGLQTQLNLLGNYSATNSLTVSLDKTKCICFNRGGRLVRNCIKLGENTIEDTKSIKYLGLIVSCNGNLKPALQNLQERARRAYYMLKLAMGPLFRHSLVITKRLFDTFVKPILLYCSDFWGMTKIGANISNPIEKKYISFCKQLLGVSKHACNIAVLSELGSHPLHIDAQKRCFDNWIRIAGTGNCNLLVAKSCQYSILKNLKWTNDIQIQLRNAGLHFLWHNVKSLKPKRVTTSRFFSILLNKFFQHSIFCMTRPESKFQIFSKLLPSTHVMAPYLYTIQNALTRMSVSKLRLVNNDLSVNKGRFQKLPRDAQLCKLCPNTIEDEAHFLLVCNLYNDLRKSRDDKICLVNDSYLMLNDNQKVIYLLRCDKNIAGIVGEFVSKSFKLRDNIDSGNPQVGL